MSTRIQSINLILQRKLNQLLSNSSDGEMMLSNMPDADVICFLLATAQDHWETASRVLAMACKQPSLSSASLAPNANITAPIHGGLLWHYYKTATSQQEGLQLVKDCFPPIIAYHQYLYSQHDKDDNGLIHQPTKRPNTTIVDPFFQSILAWSNQSLIQMGKLLDEDITEVFLWNELSIYSCQEELWDINNNVFHLLIDSQKSDYPIGSHLEFLPLFGNILTQEDAEKILIVMQNLGYPVDESGNAIAISSTLNLSAPLGVILLLALENYDMNEAASCLKAYILDLLDHPDLTETDMAIWRLLQNKESLLHRVSSLNE